MSDLTNKAFAIVDEGQDIWTTDLLVRADGQDAILTDIASWSVYVYDYQTSVLVYSLTGQSPTSPPFFNSRQGAGGFSSKPYNFRHQLPGTAWTQKGGKRYDIRYQIETVQFGMIPLNRVVSIEPSPVS